MFVNRLEVPREWIMQTVWWMTSGIEKRYLTYQLHVICSGCVKYYEKDFEAAYLIRKVFCDWLFMSAMEILMRNRKPHIMYLHSCYRYLTLGIFKRLNGYTSVYFMGGADEFIRLFTVQGLNRKWSTKKIVILWFWTLNPWNETF